MEQTRRDELTSMIEQMKAASGAFYGRAQLIDNHPFIEFTGLINEYIQCCEAALAKDIDFTECSVHAGKHLPMREHEVSYVNQKLAWIFTGRSVVRADTKASENVEQIVERMFKRAWQWGESCGVDGVAFNEHGDSHNEDMRQQAEDAKDAVYLLFVEQTQSGTDKVR